MLCDVHAAIPTVVTAFTVRGAKRMQGEQSTVKMELSAAAEIGLG